MGKLRARHCLLALAAAGLVACQGAPPPPRPAVKDPGALAAAALEKGDHATAAALYRTALAAEPERLAFHYGLGVAASYLDRKTEAVREFTWVLERGEAGSSEVKAARRWLLSAGVLPRSSAFEADSPAREESRSTEQKPAHASVQGRLLSGETPSGAAPDRTPLFLHDYPNRLIYRRVRTDENGNFRFADLPPGIYKLTDRAAGMPRWRLRVELKAGQDLNLDLGPGNSTRVRDDFPDGSKG